MTSAATRSPNRLSPTRFVVAFGVVSLLADFVYEGARSIVGPYLATLGASAALVGLITGAGEAVALVFRLGTGVVADRTGRHWALSIAGYAITLVSVPLLALVNTLWQAAGLVIAERFGKAVRSPARDTMLAHAAVRMGRGWGFGVHEALDQTGALTGPLLVAIMVAVSGFDLAFAVLAVPAAVAMLVLLRLRAAVPAPADYDPAPHEEPAGATPASLRSLPRRFWLYAAFTALSVAGYATFGVLSYHLEVRDVVPAAQIPLIYAAAMAVDAAAALASGRAYDRIGLRGLVLVPVLSAIVPFLAFTTTPALVWAGAIVWGAALGMQESTMRAAVADLVPGSRLGTGYGAFTAIYGLAWLGGSTAIGALYAESVEAVIVFTLAAQALALAAFAPLARSRGQTAGAGT